MMARISSLVLATALFLTALWSAGAQANQFDLAGVWVLQSMSFVDVATGKATQDFGEHPKGYVIYAPGGYMSVVINAEGRRPVSPTLGDATEQRAKLLTTMTSHAGPYTFSNGKLVNKVEVAHDPRMVGHDLIRFIRIIDNDHVESSTPPEDRNGRQIKTVLLWQRTK